MSLGPKRFGIAGAIVGVVAVAVFVANSLTGACSDIERLIVESEDNFAAIQGALVDSAAGEWETTYTLDGANSCSILADPEQVLYLCTWEYEPGGGQAKYDVELERVRSCLGNATERQDAVVNHPDFWASTYFEIVDGEVSVSLKNKSALGKVLVTIGASSAQNS